jgi:hypothetical protein
MSAAVRTRVIFDRTRPEALSQRVARFVREASEENPLGPDPSCFASRAPNYSACIAAALATMPDNDPERPVALTNLRNIRRVLARPNLTPW